MPMNSLVENISIIATGEHIFARLNNSYQDAFVIKNAPEIFLNGSPLSDMGHQSVLLKSTS